MLMALMISVAVNSIIIVFSLLINPEQYRTSRTARIIDVLGKPAGAFTEWIAPPGHDLGHAIIAVLIAILSSLFFYAALAWIVLSIVSWQRNRLGVEKPY